MPAFAFTGARRRFVGLCSAGLLAATGLVTAAAAAPLALQRLADVALGHDGYTAPRLEKKTLDVPPAPVSTDVVFADPLPGHDIDSPFGLRQLPWEDHARLHAGVDIAAPLGAPIGAVRDGVVADAGERAGYGRFVEVACADGLTTLYAHLKGPAAGVKRGAPVKVGDIVGYVGNTGDSTGPHLHLEIHDGERPINPALLIGKTFASAEKVPLAAAARVGRVIRIASVSHVPASKAALMAARLAGDAQPAGVRLAANGRGAARIAGIRNGRPHMLIPAAEAPGAADNGPPPVVVTPPGAPVAGG